MNTVTYVTETTMQTTAAASTTPVNATRAIEIDREARKVHADALNRGGSERHAQRMAARKRAELEDADALAAESRERDAADREERRLGNADAAKRRQAAADERAALLRDLEAHATAFAEKAVKFEASVSTGDWLDFQYQMKRILVASGFVRIPLIEKILWDASH